MAQTSSIRKTCAAGDDFQWFHLSFITNVLHIDILSIITSLAKEVMFLVALVCLLVCLSVCGQHYSKSYERIGMKFYGGVLGSTMKN